jgi:hypothetical protein
MDTGVERPAHHGFRRQVGLELGADDAGVAVRAADLAPDAAVVRAVALGLGLVDVRHALPRVPSDVFLGVHALDLNQRGVLVLVRLGPASRPSSSINDTAKKERAKATTAAADGMRISWRERSPLVPEDGSPDIEPHALTGASLHHLAAAASAAGEESSESGGGKATALIQREETLVGGGGGI